MGQRTQVLVIKQKKNGEKKASFFHHQWGYGRNMYLALIDLILQDYGKDSFNRDYNFLNTKIKTTQKFHDITDELPTEVLQNADVNDLETIKEVFKYGDNNNGGMVVEITENEDHFDSSSIRVGFLLGDEDTEREWDGELYNKGNDKEPFNRWLTPKQYGRMNGGSTYSDDTFVQIVEDFLTYFDVEYFATDDEEETCTEQDNKEMLDQLQDVKNSIDKLIEQAKKN